MIDPKQSMNEHRENLVKLSDIVLDHFENRDIKFFAYSSADGQFMRNDNDTESFVARLRNRYEDNSYTWHYTLAPSILDQTFQIKASDSESDRKAKLKKVKERILEFTPKVKINVRTNPLCLLTHLLEDQPHDNPKNTYRPDPNDPLIAINSSDSDDNNSRRQCIRTKFKFPTIKYGYRQNFVRLTVRLKYADGKGNLRSQYRFLYKRADLEKLDYSAIGREETACPEDLNELVAQKNLFAAHLREKGECFVKRSDHSRFLSDSFLSGEQQEKDLCTNSFKKGAVYANLKAYMNARYSHYVFTDNCLKSQLGTYKTTYERFADARSGEAFIHHLGAKLQARPHVLYLDQLLGSDNRQRLMASTLPGQNCNPPSRTQLLLQLSAASDQVLTFNNCQNMKDALGKSFITYSDKLRISKNKVRFELGLDQQLVSVVYISNKNDVINIPVSEFTTEMISPTVMEVTFKSLPRGYRYLTIGTKKAGL